MAGNFLTQDDVQNYGGDLVDFAQRAAAQVITPQLVALEQQTAALRDQLARETQHRVYQQLDQALPDWRRINQEPDWRRWLSGFDILSGRERQTMLNAALAEGNAGRVLQFFRGFLAENGEQAQRARSRPTTSGQRPTYTREQIAKLYRQRQQGGFSEATWARVEADIFAAQREGRISGGLDWIGR